MEVNRYIVRPGEEAAREGEVSKLISVIPVQGKRRIGKESVWR